MCTTVSCYGYCTKSCLRIMMQECIKVMVGEHRDHYEDSLLRSTATNQVKECSWLMIAGIREFLKVISIYIYIHI